MTDIRQSSIKLLTSTFSNTEGNGGTDQASAIAQQLEQAVYESHQGDTGNAYRDQLRSLHLDLSKNNVDLAKKLVNGQISAQQLIQAGPEGMKTDERARQDDEMREQGLRESLGTHKIPVHETAGELGGPTAADTLGQEGEVGIQEASMGEEGDFKQRAQPKIQGLEGIEFESGL